MPGRPGRITGFQKKRRPLSQIHSLAFRNLSLNYIICTSYICAELSYDLPNEGKNGVIGLPPRPVRRIKDHAGETVQEIKDPRRPSRYGSRSGLLRYDRNRCAGEMHRNIIRYNNCGCIVWMYDNKLLFPLVAEI